MYSVVLAAMLTAGASSSTGWCHGCRGCHGYASCHGYVASCHGCSGYRACYGGCYGSYCSGCYGCYGSHGCYGCTGCCGGVVYSGCCGGCCGGVIAPGAPAPEAPPAPKAAAPMTQSPGSIQRQVARLTVKVPESAKLWVDDVYCPITFSERSFNTPSLEPGRQYFYTLRLEVEKDGEVVTENRRVFVAAGQKINVDFSAPTAVAVQR